MPQLNPISQASFYRQQPQPMNFSSPAVQFDAGFMATPSPAAATPASWMQAAMQSQQQQQLQQQQQQQMHDARMRAMMAPTPVPTPSLAGEAAFMTAEQMFRMMSQFGRGE
jgi:hypothetical protein